MIGVFAQVEGLITGVETLDLASMFFKKGGFY